VGGKEVSGVKFVKSNLHGEHRLSEDAPPLAEDLGGGWFLLGAFDGLGGTGSDRYLRKHDGAERTGAYIASRVAARAVRDAKRDLVRIAREAATARAPVAEAVASYLSECFQSSFRSAMLELEKRPTTLRVRGALTLPTTVATVLGRTSHGRTDLAVLWLGDSHIYCFRRGPGLQLLTTEEFEPGSNAEDFFENALGPLGEYRDRGMAQALHAQEKQTLRTAEHVFDDVVFIIAATDGVYDAFRSVLTFESALLEAVVESRSAAAFEESFSSLVGRYRQDDATFAFLANDDDWSNVQMAAKQRLAQLAPFRADPAQTWAEYRADFIAIPGRPGMAFAADAPRGFLPVSQGSDGPVSPWVPSLVLDQAPSQEIVSGQSGESQPSPQPDGVHVTRIPLPPEYSEVADHQSLHGEEPPGASDAGHEPVPAGPLAKSQAGATERRPAIAKLWTQRPRPSNIRPWHNRHRPRDSTIAVFVLVPLVLIALGIVVTLWPDEKKREIASALQGVGLLTSGSQASQTESLRALERYQALSTGSGCSKVLETSKNDEIKPETKRNLMDDAQLARRVNSQFAWYIPDWFAPNGWQVASPQFVCNLWLLRRYLDARDISLDSWVDPATRAERDKELSEARFLVHAVSPLTDVGRRPQEHLEALRAMRARTWLPGVTLTRDDLDWLRRVAEPVLEEVAAQLETAGYPLGGDESWNAISGAVKLFQSDTGGLSVDGLLRRPTREALASIARPAAPLKEATPNLGEEAEKRISEVTQAGSPSADPPPNRPRSAGATVYLHGTRKAEARQMLVELDMIKERDGGWGNPAILALRQFREQQNLSPGIGLPTEEDYANLQREKQKALEEKVEKAMADPAQRANIGRTLFRSGLVPAQTSDESQLRVALNDFSQNRMQPPHEAIDHLDKFLADRVKDASGELVHLGYLGKSGDGKWTVEFDQALKAFMLSFLKNASMHSNADPPHWVWLGFYWVWPGRDEIALSEGLLDALKAEIHQHQGRYFDGQEMDKRAVEFAQKLLGFMPDGAWGRQSQEKLKAFLGSQGLYSDGSLTVASFCAVRRCQ
jgi:serine/threonine protein phosphatase PrpC